MLTPRDDEAWLAALRGADDVAVGDLHAYLVRVLAKVLQRAGGVSDDDLHDFAQDAIERILANLHAFRGDAAFTTWATAIATRVAFTALRRRSAQEDGRRRFEEVRRAAEAASVARPHLPGETAEARDRLLAALREAIATSLSARQRVAVLAELRGLPTVDIAARLDTNTNALYKLTHDARRKLRAALTAAGFTPDVVHDILAEPAER